MKKLLNFLILGLFLAVAVTAGTGNAFAAVTLKSIVGSPTTITISQPNQSVAINAIAVVERGSGDQPGDTDAVTITWGIQGAGGASFGGGSISINAGANNNVGTGTANFTVTPGTYTVYANMGSSAATGNTITVTSNAIQVPTQAAVITQVESDPIPATESLIYRKTEVKVYGTCQFSGQTIEIQLDSSVVGSILTTGTNWAYTVTVPADDSFHNVTAITGAGLTSNSVSVKVDITAPQFSITYDPSTMPFGASTVRVTMTVNEAVSTNAAETTLNIIPPNGVGIPLTLTPMPAGAYAQTFTTSFTVGKDASNKPTINGTPTQDGSFTMMAFARDQAKPGGNPGTVITQGSSFTINVSGPSSSGARVIIANDAQYTNSRTLNFTWQGFSHSLGVDRLSKYWYIASQTPPANADTSDTAGWKDGGPGANGGGTGSLSATDEGTWEVYVKAQDNLGNFSTSAKDSIIVDSVGPNLVAGSQVPAAGFANGTEQTEILCSIHDAISGVDRNTAVITVNGTQYGVGGTSAPGASPAVSLVSTGTPGTYQLMFKPQIIGLKYPRGTVNVSVTANDMVGNPLGGTANSPGSPATWSFIVSTNIDAPAPHTPQPVADRYYNSKRPSISLHLDDGDFIDRSSLVVNVSNGSSYMTFNVGPNLVLNDPPTGGTDSVMTLTPPTDFVDGTVTVTVSAKDRIGNVMTPYSWSFHVDTTPPAPSSPSPADNTVVTTTTPIISLKLDDAGAGLDTSTDSVRLRINFISLANPSNSFTREFTIDSATEPGLTYNASTRTLVFNPTLANNFTLGVGSVEAILVTARDRAVSPPDGTAALPNVLTENYKWSFSISTSAGPIVAFAESTPTPPTSPTVFNFTNIEPLVIRTTLVDDDLINHSSLLIDFNGRTFRDGDAQVSWQSGTTNEILILDLRNEGTLIKQGTNEVILRAANDRTGRPLQNAPVELSFLYDTIGPVANTPNPSDGGIIYDLNNGVVKCKLTDNFSGIARAALQVRDNGTLLNTYGTDSTPVNLVYDSANSELIFRTTTPYVSGHGYQFTVVPPTSAGGTDGTADRAGNGLGKTNGSTATNSFSWSLTAASTSDVVLLVSPENDTFVNVTDPNFCFSWKAHHHASMYRLEISGNLSFSEPQRYDTTAISFTDDTLQNQLLEHGKIYYWQVSALNSSGQTFGTSERRQFTVDKLPPQMPKIVGVVDYLGLNPKHENTAPLSNTTYVKQRRIRIKTLLYEGAPSTVGYTISAGYLQIVDGALSKYVELGTKSDVHGYDTNEVDITFPDQDGEYRVVTFVKDRAGNTSTQSEQARIYLNRKIPKINSIILTDPSPNSNGYITSGKVKFEVVFNTPIDMLPLADYVTPPSIKFDPRSADGTTAIEITELAVSGKSVTGFGYIPYGQGTQFDGMADIIITGFMDAAWNAMDGGSVTYYKHFEIDTAPGFVVKTFLNPIDEKNVLINIQASETLLFAPACYITASNGDVNQMPVNIMAKNLYATSTTGTVGENNIRISGLDTRNNIGYWPPADVLKDGKFLMAQCKANQGSVIESRDMGVKVEIPGRAITDNVNMYVFNYKLEYVGNDYLAKLSSGASKSPARMAAVDNLKSSGETLKIKTENNKLMMVSYNSERQAEVKVQDAPPVKNLESGTAKQSDAELEQISRFYEISPVRGLKKAGKISIDCVLNPEEKTEISKMAVYFSTDGILWERAGGTYDGSKFVADMKYTGVYGVFADKKEPRFLKPALEGKTVLDSSRPELFTFVSDFGSGIDPDRISVLIDGVTHKASYDEKDNKIYYLVYDELKAGNHDIVFEVADHSGNVSRQALTVIAPAASPDIINAISYPNPARRGSNATISFTVNGTLGNAVDAKIYIYDSNANRVTELIPMQNGNNFRAVWLGLTNEDGKIVANGVYFYKIKVNCADKNVEKYGKIAVLR